MPTRPHLLTSKGSRPSASMPRASAARRGYDAHWRRLRLAVLADVQGDTYPHGGPLCRDCQGRGVTEPACHVDHIVSREKGGTDDPANLMSLCHRCHSRKTAREDGAFGLTPKASGIAQGKRSPAATTPPTSDAPPAS